MSIADENSVSNELPWLHPERVHALQHALSQRILVLDGAMGTMLQRHGLDEADFRGQRFACGCGADEHDHGQDLKGNNDLLVLTQPDVVRGVHQAYLDAGVSYVIVGSKALRNACLNNTVRADSPLRRAARM